MLYRIIKSTLMIVLSFFSFVNITNAQLKPWDNTNQVLIDIHILEKVSDTGGKVLSISKFQKSKKILNPPSRMPKSQYYGYKFDARSARNLPRLKLTDPRNVSKKSTNLKRSRKVYKKHTQKPSAQELHRKARKINKSKRIKKQYRRPKKIENPTKKTPTKKSKKKQTINTSPSFSLRVKTPPAPSPKAIPKSPVSILETPPPTPKIIRSTSHSSQKTQKKQLAMRSNKMSTQPEVEKLIFRQGNANLTDSARATLNRFSILLNSKPQSRMQLLAYAGEPNISASKARRLSLSRALAARSYLIEKGIRSTRIDVRALGNRVTSGVPNRVDVKVMKGKDN